MSQSFQVSMGEMAFGRDNAVLSTGGVGSCLVICMYDREAKIGGLAHSMLPRRKGTESQKLDSEAKYVDDTIGKMIVKLMELGASRERLAVKIAGGASMFHIFKDRGSKGVGEQNVEVAHEEISKYKLALLGEDTGGASGRTVDFNVANGVLNVNLKI